MFIPSPFKAPKKYKGIWTWVKFSYVAFWTTIAYIHPLLPSNTYLFMTYLPGGRLEALSIPSTNLLNYVDQRRFEGWHTEHSMWNYQLDHPTNGSMMRIKAIVINMWCLHCMDSLIIEEKQGMEMARWVHSQKRSQGYNI
jgi:hypothetical protein